MSAYRIEDVPLPPANRPGPKPVYPFAELRVGQSFVVEAERARRVRASASSYSRRYGVRIETRLQADGSVRVGRVE